MNLNVHVPIAGKLSWIDEGSAIVSIAGRSDEKTVHCHYEGGRSVPMSFRRKAIHAGGRLVHRYPTIATAVVGAGDLATVARFDTARQAFVEILDETTLCAWARETVESILGRRFREGEVDPNLLEGIERSVHPLWTKDVGLGGPSFWLTDGGQVLEHKGFLRNRGSSGGRNGWIAHEWTSEAIPVNVRAIMDARR